MIRPKIRHRPLQTLGAPAALHLRRFGERPYFWPPSALREDLFGYFDFPEPGMPVEVFFASGLHQALQ